MENKIPTSIIGLLSRVLSDQYTHADINSLFLYSGAPGSVPEGNKAAKVQSWLRQINLESSDPLKILGKIVDDFMEKQVPRDTFQPSISEEQIAKLEAEKAHIRETLGAEGLTFIRGGSIVKGGAVPTLSLDANVKKHGLASVDTEIKRALSLIERDPQAAAHYAANVLEASLKAYLDYKCRTYGNKDALAEL